MTLHPSSEKGPQSLGSEQVSLSWRLLFLASLYTQTLGSLESCPPPTNLPHPLISGYLSHSPVFIGLLALLGLRPECPTLACWLRSAANQMYLGSIWTPHRTPILSPTLTLKPSTSVLLLCSRDEHVHLQGCPVQTPDTTKGVTWSLVSTIRPHMVL